MSCPPAQLHWDRGNRPGALWGLAVYQTLCPTLWGLRAAPPAASAAPAGDRSRQQSSGTPGSILILPTAPSLRPGWGSPGIDPGPRPVPALSARSRAHPRAVWGRGAPPQLTQRSSQCGRDAGLRAGPAHPRRSCGERVPGAADTPHRGRGMDGAPPGQEPVPSAPQRRGPRGRKAAASSRFLPGAATGRPGGGFRRTGTTATARQGAWSPRARLYRGSEGGGTGRERRCPTKRFPRDQPRPAIGAGRAPAHREWAGTAPSRHA